MKNRITDRSAWLPLPILLIAAGLSGCTATAPEEAGPAGQTVQVDVQPPTAQVAPGGTVAFSATVTGSADTAVLWDVVEAGGGTVSGAGLYSAPGVTGTFQVRARARANPASQALAVVTVTPAPVVAVTIAPRTTSVATGGTRTFTATVTGSANGAVTWSVVEAGCGSVTAAGAYTAPAAAGTCHVVATSVADPTKNDIATVTVTAPTPVTVAVSPASGSVDSCRTLTFAATVTGAADGSVTWSVQEGAAGGTVSAAGVYTAPDVAGTYRVVATSRADPSKSAVATVVVSDRILSVAVTPSSTSAQAGGTAQFSATVTTTCGTFAATNAVLN